MRHGLDSADGRGPFFRRWVGRATYRWGIEDITLHGRGCGPRRNNIDALSLLKGRTNPSYVDEFSSYGRRFGTGRTMDLNDDRLERTNVEYAIITKHDRAHRIGASTVVGDVRYDIPDVIWYAECAFGLNDDSGDIDGTGMRIIYRADGNELSCSGGPRIVETGGGSRLEVASKGAIVVRVPPEAVDELVGAAGEGVLGGEMDGIRVACKRSCTNAYGCGGPSPSRNRRSYG